MDKRPSHNSKILTFIAFAILFIAVFLISSGLSAESKIPEVRNSVKPLDLSRTPTTNELMTAGQLGGQLYPTEDIEIEDSSVPQKGNALKAKSLKDPKKLKRNKDINLSFGKAIDEWNRHEYKKAVKMFKKHAEDYPDSPWTDEALLHVGCDARYNGRYTEAEEQFTRIMEKNRDSEHYGAKMLLNKARSRLAVLKVLQSNFNEATGLFGELKKDSPDWRHRTYASHWIQRISRYKADELALLNCGTQALAHVLKRDGRETESREVMEIKPSSLKGHSLKDLKSIAKQYGYKVEGLKLSVAELQSIPLPAVIQINAKNKGDKGHYWVLEKIDSNGLMLFDPQSGRRFHQSPDEFSREWNGNTLVFFNGENLPGVRITEDEMEIIYGACCGIPRPEDNLGGEGGDGYGNMVKVVDKMSEGFLQGNCPTKKGAPIWKVNMTNLNLYVTDIPLWYTPPIGPRVSIQLSYNSQSATAYNEPFGNKWMFNYGSYLVEDTGGGITIFMPDGRRDIYTPDGAGGYTKPYKVYNELTKIANNHYELSFLDDTVYVYDIPAGTSSLQPFLVEIRDAYGQSLTFTYNTNIQLTTITIEATNQDFILSYNANGLVDQVTDPFNRSATFLYDANSNLTKITDMGGYWTVFDYDADVYLTKIENQRGAWTFYIEPTDNLLPGMSNQYPPPGDNMWMNYRITVTNPSGDIEEFFYRGDYQSSWYVSPRDYIHWLSTAENNNSSTVPKTYYFLWLPAAAQGRGEIRKIVYPEGGLLDGYIEYDYDNSNGNLTSVTDNYGHITSYTYNNHGRITSITDPKGFVTNLTYASNGVDLLEIQNGLGAITLTYNSTHDVTSITDRLGNTTSLTYNTYGQLTSSTDALGIITTFTYDANNQLQQISKDGNVLENFTYDATGRIDTHTNATGLALDYNYNNLNNITKVTYPDAKFISYTYAGCCPHLIDSVTNRSGKTTSYTYDEMKRIIESIDHQSRVIKFEYDPNGNLSRLIDSNSNVTTYEYNLDNRLVKKNYADGKYERFGWYYTGLLSEKTDARGIITSYTYDQNYNLQTITYTDATPAITYTYDNFNRLIQRQDGMGTYLYSYDANNRLTSMDGPWSNDTITFQYNELGHLKPTTPQGGQTITYYYDYDPENSGNFSLGRLKDIQAGANTYTYHYSGANPLIQSLTRSNGSITEYLYNDPLKRLTEITNKDSSQATINQHIYTYNNLDLIATETITTGTAIDTFTEGLKTYNYNNLNQLLNSTNPAETFIYDDDGNMTQGYTPDGYSMTMTYDAENRLVSAEYTDSGSVVHRTEYFYSGDGLLAQVKKYQNGNPISDTRFIRAGFMPIQERDGSNNVVREYIWGLNKGGGIGGLLNLKQSGQDYNYLYDGKGNIMAVIDSNQQPVAYYRYDVFGEPMKKVGTFNQPFRFSTKRYDEATGLLYYGYRFYNPIIGRWMTRDPLGEAVGINLYQVVGNSAVNYVDPMGLTPAVAVPIAVQEAYLILSAATLAYLYSPQGQAMLHSLYNEIQDLIDKLERDKEKLKQCKTGTEALGQPPFPGPDPNKPPEDPKLKWKIILVKLLELISNYIKR